MQVGIQRSDYHDDQMNGCWKQSLIHQISTRKGGGIKNATPGDKPKLLLLLLLVLIMRISNAVLLLLRELKDSVNSIYRRISILPIFGKICSLLVFTSAIFSPCLVEGRGFFFVQEEGELVSCHLVLTESNLKDIWSFGESIPAKCWSLTISGAKASRKRTPAAFLLLMRESSIENLNVSQVPSMVN